MFFLLHLAVIQMQHKLACKARKMAMLRKEVQLAAKPASEVVIVVPVETFEDTVSFGLMQESVARLQGRRIQPLLGRAAASASDELAI